MNERLLDCRGMACPQPVLEVKRVLELDAGAPILAIVDNEAARGNVFRLARSFGRPVVVEESTDGAFRISIGAAVSSRQEGPAGDVGETLAGEAADGMVYFITTSSLGQGSPDLGEVLMKSLMVTLTAQAPPVALLMLNTGVYLAVDDSPVLEQLNQLARAGTSILVCGTCLDYYKLKDRLMIGTVSNMHEINSHLCGPSKVITVG